jgi:hypothetical protein
MDEVTREETALHTDSASRTAHGPAADGRPPGRAAFPGLRTRPVAGAVRTCVPARHGQGGYPEPVEPGPEEHIVRGED